MKSIMRLSLLLLITTAMFTSCKKAVPKAAKHIPKEATFVATINTKSLQSKLAKSQATIENIIKTMSDSDTALNKGKSEWEDLKNSGIDLDENLYVSVVQKGGSMSQGTGTGVFSGIASLKDATKFEAYVKKKHPQASVQKEKDYSYATQDDNMIAWGNDVIIFMSYQKQYSGGMTYDSVTKTYNFSKPADVSSTNNLKAEMAAYMSQKEDASVASIPEFRDLMQEKSDGSFWMNSASSIEDLPIPLPKVKELLANSFTAATFDFEDGKMVAHSKSYLSKDMADLVKKYTGPTADLTLIENYPSSNINAFFVFAFNPDFINGLVSYLEVGGMVDGYLTKAMGTPYTLKQALKSIKGDMAFVVSDLTIPAGSDSTRAQEMMKAGGKGMMSMVPAKLLFNIPVGDKAELNKLLDKLTESQMLVKQNNEYKLNPMMQAIGFQFSVDDKNILLASDSLTVVQYKNKASKAVLDADVMKTFKDKSGVMYIDLQKIMNAIPNDTTTGKVLASAKETFKDMQGYSENFNGKYTEGHFELRMKNEKENSLTSLINFFGVAAETAKAASKKFDQNFPADSTAPVTPGQ